MDNTNPIDPKSQETISERIAIDKARVLEAAKNTLSITGASAKIGISRATIYRWEQEDPEFKKMLTETILLRMEALRDGALIKFNNYVVNAEHDYDWRAQLSLIKYAETRIARLTKEQSPSGAEEEFDAKALEALGEVLIAASKKVKENTT